MNEILLIISLACMTHLWVTSEPTSKFREWLGFSAQEYENMNKMQKFLFRLMTCHSCSGFWIGFVFSNFYFACIVAVLSSLVEKITRPKL
jgi:hypothetical protein